MSAIESIINTTLSALGHAFAGLALFFSLFFPAAAPTPVWPAISTTLPPTTAEPATQPEATTTKPAPVVTPTPKKTETTAVAQTPAVQPAPAAPTAPTKDPEALNIETRASLVNILCTAQVGVNGISGSGVIVDSRGVILTNAHIGQFFLLKDYLTNNNIDCTIRTGSPAARTYRARLLYIPPLWVADNASQLKAQKATGTGENDYAFLYITGRTDPQASLPASFAALTMDAAYPDIGNPMLLAAYPAGFLSGQLIEKSLYASSAFAYVTQLFSFDDNTQKVDLFSIGGTVVSQGGSSGGAAVHATDGKLAGIIATATSADSTENRDLRAITISHINSSLAKQGKGGIVQLLTGDVAAKSVEFNAQVAPGLTTQLEAVFTAN